MTIKKFRLLDLLLLSVIAILVDVLGYFASKTDLPLPVALSIVIILIAYIRWGIKAIFINVIVFGLKLILYRDFNLIPLIILFFQSFGMLVVFIGFKFFDKNKIRNSLIKVFIYYTVGYIGMLLGSLIIIIVNKGGNFESVLWINLFNYVLGLVVMFIASKQKNFMIDMNKYLRVIAEKNKEKGSDYRGPNINRR